MGGKQIRSSIDAATEYLTEHPDEARYTDSAATATLVGGLQIRVGGPAGETLITDMPASVGGGPHPARHLAGCSARPWPVAKRP